MKNKIILSVLLFIISTPTIIAQTEYEAVHGDSIALDPKVRYGKLENGFTYYLHPNSVPQDQIEIHFIIKAGGFHEDEDQRGYAHLFEHMGIKSSKKIPDLRNYIRNNGGYANAKTSGIFEEYDIYIPSKNKQLLKEVLHWMGDFNKDVPLEQSSIDVERGAVLGEGRTNDPHNFWENMMRREHLFRNTNYRKILSDRKFENRDQMIINFDREAFIRFYRDWYRPDLEALTVVGDFNVDSMEVQVKEIFSQLKTPKNLRNAPEFGRTKINGKNQFEKVVDTLNTNPRMVFTSKSESRSGFDVKNQADYRNLLIQGIYTDIIKNRSKSIKHKYDSPISFFNINIGEFLSEARFTLNFDSNNHEYLKERIVSALLIWKKLHTGLTQTELKRSKNQTVQRYQDQVQDNMSLSKRYKNHFVKNVAVPGVENELTIVKELLKEIDLTEIQSYANEMQDLKSNKDFLFFAGPDSIVPNFTLVRKWVEEAAEITVSAMEAPMPPIKSLTGKLNIPEINIDKFEIITNKVGVTKVELPNNIMLILKPSVPSSQIFENSVNVLAYISPGVPYKNTDNYVVSNLAPEVIQYSGAGPYTKFELNEFQWDKKMRIHMKADVFSQYIQGSSKIDDIDEFFSLINLYATKPRIDKLAFKEWKSRKMDEIKGIGGRTSSAFFENSIKQKEYPSLPKYTYDDISALEMDEIYDAFSQRFSSFDGYTFIITGDFNTKELIPNMIRYILALPVDGKITPRAGFKPEFDLKKKDEKIEIANAKQVFVHLSFPLIAEQGLKSEIILKLLGAALNDRIYSKLREGTYSPRAFGSWLNKEKGIYTFKILFDSELGNEEKLIRYAKEEFRNLQKNGVDQEWLQNAINNEKIIYEKNIDRFGYSSFWQAYLQEKLENGEDIESEVLQYKTILEHFISLEDVNTAAKKYMSEENLQQFLVIPNKYKIQYDASGGDY